MSRSIFAKGYNLVSVIRIKYPYYQRKEILYCYQHVIVNISTLQNINKLISVVLASSPDYC